MTQSIPIYIAVEDELSEWVIKRILGMRQVQYSFGKILTARRVRLFEEKRTSFQQFGQGVSRPATD